MRSPALDIAEYLALSGRGALGIDIFVGRLPDTPDAVLAVFSPSGAAPQVFSTDNPAVRKFLSIDRPTVQVIVRAARGGYESGYAKALAARTLLHGITSTSIGGTFYHLVLASSDIGELGLDEAERPVFSINFNVERSEL